jgi:hypothetical protein
VSYDQAAWYHCTTGYNQNGTLTNHCFYTPKATNYESNWWWCADKGSIGAVCPEANQKCYNGDGGPLDESWYDSNNKWLTNSSDCIHLGDAPGYPWVGVYGP